MDSILNINNFSPVFCIVFALLMFIIIFCDKKYNMLRDVSTATPRPYSWSRVQLAWWIVIILASFITVICCYPGHPIPTFNSSILILLGITTGTTAAARLIDVADKQNPNLQNTLQDGKQEGFFLDILSDCNGVSMHRLQTVIFNFVFGLWFIAYILEHYNAPWSGIALTLKDAAPALNSASLPADMKALSSLPIDTATNLPAIFAKVPAIIKDCILQPWNYIIPEISQNNLILLGMSSATYAALKAAENSPTAKGEQINAQKAAQADAEQPAAVQPGAPANNNDQADVVPDEANNDQPAQG